MGDALKAKVCDFGTAWLLDLNPSKESHSHRRRVYSCDWDQDVVKQSRYFLGGDQMVKQCFKADDWKGHHQAFMHAHCVVNGLRAKIQCSQAVKAIFDGQKRPRSQLCILRL